MTDPQLNVRAIVLRGGKIGVEVGTAMVRNGRK